MRAIVLTGYGDVDKLEPRDLPQPKAAAGEIVVRMAGASINPVDWKIRSGAAKGRHAFSFPGVLGRDASGEVVEVGKGVTRFEVGDRVLGLVQGAYAELVTAPSESWAKIPPGLDMVEAGALPLVLVTGAQLVEEAVRASRGQIVLVTGAVGSVGRVAVFAAKQRGVTVWAGVRGSQREEATKLGAAGIVALDDDADIARLPRLDAIADTVDGETIKKLYDKLKPGGTIGSVLGEPAGAKERGFVVRAFMAHPDPEMLERYAKAVAEGKLVIPIAQRVPLASARDAQKLAESHPGGKIVLIGQSQSQTHGQASSATRSGNGAPPKAYQGFDTMPIAGRWREGRSGKRRSDHDPWTGETLLEITLADDHDVDEAYREAARAQRAWGAALPRERRQVLLNAAHIMERRREEVVQWLVRESGGTRIKAGLEHQLVVAGLYEAASYPAHVEGKILAADIRGKESRVYRSPVGVVGIISPWNFPLQLTNRSVAPALAVGNAVVVKPASDTPVTGGLLLAKIFEEAGLPPGLFSVVVGSGSTIGDAFVTHPVPRVISFTGSTPVGRHIGELAGRGVKKVCLELGGNGPLIVLDDADLDLAVHAALVGKFMHQGQICMAVNRILVDGSLYDRFLERFTEGARALRVGDRDDPHAVIGPIINKSQLESIEKKVEASIAAGARAVVRGETKGLLLPPIVLADVTNDMPCAREELFGPVAPILRVDGEEEAIRIANDTEYGLSSAVFTRDAERGVAIAKRIEAGMTHVNDVPVNDEPNTAFGGEKASGLGRFGGAWAIDEFTTDHWISVQHERRPYPF